MLIKRYGLYFAWLLSSIGVLLSLYFSDIRNHEPCNLCWYQRICLFPLALILGVAAYRGFLDISRYVIWQVMIGFFLALYQVAIQEIPGWNPIDMCGAGPSCSEKFLIGIGPITFPMLSAVGFAIIGILLAAVWASVYKEKKSTTKGENNFSPS